MYKSHMSIPVIYIGGILFLWLSFKVIDFGALWQSTHDVRHNVTVTLNDDSEIKGSLTSNWNGDEVLIGKDNSRIILRDYKMLQFPTEGQPERGFPYRIFLPFLLYAHACYFGLRAIVLRMRKTEEN